MAVDERRQRLHRRLEEVLGPEEAQTLMDDLGTPRLETELLRRDLQLLEARMDTKLAALEGRLLEKMNEQTKTLFRTFIVTNSAMVLAVATLPLAFLLMGYGVMRQPVLNPLAASLRSFWLYVHVFFAWLAFGAYALAMAGGIVYLLKRRDTERAVHNPIHERFPTLERLDELVFRWVVFGFVTDAVMIASGAIWARDLWGSYWSWDPVETWSLVTWLVYGLAIHLRVTRGWTGARFARVAALAIAGMIITFFGVTFVVETSNHFFNVR